MAYSIDMRERAVSYVREGGLRSEACRLFQIDRKTLYHWLRVEDLRPKAHGPRRRKLDKSSLAAHVRDYPDAYLHERAAHFGVHISSISRALRALDIRKKNDALR